jgi:NCAIR mutase (PurE)-related protein
MNVESQPFPPDLTPDRDRERRLGFDEAVLCQAKTPEQLERLLRAEHAARRRALLTRLAVEKWRRLPSDLRAALDYEELSGTAILGEPLPARGDRRVSVVTAGSSDVGVAREAVRTLRYYRVAALEIYDVGVAGLWRLQSRLAEIEASAASIVVAGMDCALPSVLAGLVAHPVIAVPSSTGYGVATGGRTALDAALASCAPGLAVVNIDNGYGAACVALRMLRARGT